MAIEGLFSPFKTHPVSQGRRTPPIRELLQFLQINFSLLTWILLGACIQGSILLVVKNAYALLPAVALLLIRAIDSCLMASNVKRNIYMQDVIPGKVAALSVNEDGEYSAAGEKIAILLLGAKSNHPFGVFAPGFGEMAGHLDKMHRNLDDNAATNGFLGQTAYTRADERGAIEICVLTYWRDLYVLHDFAHSPVHREAWDWWRRTLKEHAFIGINHEIYEADKGSWENVYENFQPTGLGATTFLKKGGKLQGGVVSDEWVSPLVDVNRGRLSKSSGRLGWDPTKYDVKSPY